MNTKRVAGIILAALFLFYLYTVLWFTVLARTRGISIVHDEFFWSVQKWLSGDWSIGKQILENVAMFIPFGFLLPVLFFQPEDETRRPIWKLALITFLCGLAFSGLIEFLQLIGMRGTFELDDLFSNTLGAMAGMVLYRLISRWKWMTAGVLVCIAVVCAGVILKGGDYTKNESDALPKAFCFRTEKAENREGTVSLTGVAFRYNHPEWTGTVVLRSTKTGQEITLKTDREERPEVNDYFLCEQDYTKAGFKATGTVDSEEEYEILIRFPFSTALSTGEYLTGDRIHYYPDEMLREPEAAGTDLEEIIREGALRVFRPDYHCWVYQKDNRLYWITEPGFNFEEDGTTLIQYRLWTTQTDRLPEKRLSHNWFWDNIKGYYENYELKGNYGEYRASCREIPEEYAITAILTGYYKNKKWVWREYFRPVYGWQ